MKNENLTMPMILFITTILVILIAFFASNRSNNKYDIRIDKIDERILKLTMEVDILIGKMKTYENLPVDLRSRISTLETRIDNIIFFKQQMDQQPPAYEEEDN